MNALVLVSVSRMSRPRFRLNNFKKTAYHCAILELYVALVSTMPTAGIYNTSQMPEAGIVTFRVGESAATGTWSQSQLADDFSVIAVTTCTFFVCVSLVPVTTTTVKPCFWNTIPWNGFSLRMFGAYLRPGKSFTAFI